MKRGYGKYILLLSLMLSICVMVCVACKGGKDSSETYSTESETIYEESSSLVSTESSTHQNSTSQSTDTQYEQSSIPEESSTISVFESSLEISVESSEFSSVESVESSVEESINSSENTESETSLDSSIIEESIYSSDDFIDISDDSSVSSSSIEEDSSEDSSSSSHNCGNDDYEEGEFVVDHIFVTHVEPPDCTKSGYKRTFCIGCDMEVFYEEYEPLGHKEVIVPGFSSTCCTYGATESSYCERCEIELTASQKLPFSDHSYDWGSCKWCDLAILQFKMIKRDFEEPYAVCIGPYTDATMKHPNARRVVIPAEVAIRNEKGEDIIYPVKEVAEVAFAMHYEIYSVEIGENIEKIGPYAFEGCYNLKEVYDKSKTQVTKGGLYKNGWMSAYVKEEDFHYEEYDSKISFSETGCIIYTDEEDSILIGCRNTHQEVVIPEGVTKIGPYVFASAYQVSKITIAASVTFMERYAFCYICPIHRVLDKTDCPCKEPFFSVVFLNPNDWYIRAYELQEYKAVEIDLSIEENAFNELMGKRDYYWTRKENL